MLGPGYQHQQFTHGQSYFTNGGHATGAQAPGGAVIGRAPAGKGGRHLGAEGDGRLVIVGGTVLWVTAVNLSSIL